MCNGSVQVLLGVRNPAGSFSGSYGTLLVLRKRMGGMVETITLVVNTEQEGGNHS